MAGETLTGKAISMHYSVANVTVALDSISQICDKGCRVVFEQNGGFIETPSGNKVPFERGHDTYVRTVRVRKQPGRSSGFARPSPQDS